MREVVVDANILLRYLTNEPRELADRAAALLQTAEEKGVALVVAPLTLAEVVYVLESVYGWNRDAVADGLLQFVSAGALVVLEHDLVAQTLECYRDVPGLDFADAYVLALAKSRGHGTVISFDRRMQRVPGTVVIDDPEQLQAD
jgi:predicted nucleic acid-binding protein